MKSMSYKIKLTPLATQNIEDSVTYYKNIASKKVAKNFVADFKKTVSIIRETKYFQVFFGGFRGKTLKNFPFIVFYTIHEDKNLIVIRAVFHTSQNTTKYPKE